MRAIEVSLGKEIPHARELLQNRLILYAITQIVGALAEMTIIGNPLLTPPLMAGLLLAQVQEVRSVVVE